MSGIGCYDTLVCQAKPKYVGVGDMTIKSPSDLVDVAANHRIFFVL